MKISASKRDVDAIGRRLLYFYPHKWDVIMGEDVYQLDENYNLYKDGEITDLTCLITLYRGNYVYEGQLITISDGSKGILKRKDVEEKLLTKLDIANSPCSLTGPSASYYNNQIVREEDVIPPGEVKFYFDSYYFTVHVLITNGFLHSFPMGGATESEVKPGISYTPEQHKTMCNEVVECYVGDVIRITKNPNIPNDIVLANILGYTSLTPVVDTIGEGIVLGYDGEDQFFEFVITGDCYTLFNVAQSTFPLWVAEASVTLDEGDYTASLSAEVEGESTILWTSTRTSDSTENTNTPITVETDKLVILTLNTDITSIYTTTLVITPIDGESQTLTLIDNQCSFTMPAAATSIELEIKVEGSVVVRPPVSTSTKLTILSDDLTQMVVNGEPYNVGAVIDIDKGDKRYATAEVSWSTELPSISKILVYPTNGSPTTLQKTSKTTTTVTLILDLTIKVDIDPVSCKYTTLTGLIEGLKQGKYWTSDSNLIMEVTSQKTKDDLDEYRITTDQEIFATPSGAAFELSNVFNVDIFTNSETFSIGARAFDGCMFLTNMSLEGDTQRVTVLDFAFRHTEHANVNFLDKVTYLGKCAFRNSGVTKFEANPNLYGIPKQAFEHCDKLTSVDLSATSLAGIDSLAFNNCSTLIEAIIPQTLSTLGNQVFGETKFKAVHTDRLADVKVNSDNSESLLFKVDSEHKNGLTTLPRYTFEFCKSLEEVHLPSSITHIEKGAFHECDNLKHFAAPGLKTIELGAFYGTWIEEFLTYNKLEESYHNSVVNQHVRLVPNTSGIYFDFSGDADKDVHLTCIRTSSDDEKYVLYQRHGQVNSSIRPSLDIISISDYAFKRDENIFDPTYFVYLDECSYLTHIGNYAFENTNISSIHLPTSGSITEIGLGAFKNCKHLLDVINFLGLNITKIPTDCFYNCGDNLNGIGATYDGNLSSLKANSTFYIPSTTTVIGDRAFAECRQLMGIGNIDNCKIHTIGKEAFMNCFRNTAYKTVTWLLIGGVLLATVVTICCCVYGFPAGAAVLGRTGGTIKILWKTIEAGTVGSKLIPSIALSSKICIAVGIAGLSGLTPTYIAMPDKWRRHLRHTSVFDLPYVTKLGDGAFKGCSHLGITSLNCNIEEIPDDAYNGCKRLGVISLVEPSSLKEGVILSGIPKLKRIGKRAFQDCRNLTSASLVSLLATCETIDDYAFNNAKIWYSEDDESIDSIVLSPKLKKIGIKSLYIDSPLHLIIPIKDPTNIEIAFQLFKTNDVHLTIPKGSIDKYKIKFPELSDTHFIELDDNDSIWSYLKASGYDIPWASDIPDPTSVDLGLSVKWCNCNLGAVKEEDPGFEFAWAVPFGAMSFKEDLSEEEKSRTITEEYDAATQSLGDGWRIPSVEQFDELLTQCTWEWTTKNNISGYIVTGPNGNSIFLPARGERLDPSVERWSYYRTLSKSNNELPYALGFTSEFKLTGEYGYVGGGIRPVYSE